MVFVVHRIDEQRPSVLHVRQQDGRQDGQRVAPIGPSNATNGNSPAS
jgi:hypothetical protein